MTTPVAVGIDLGGTNLNAGAVDEDGRILALRSIPVDLSQGPEAVIRQATRLVDELLTEAAATRRDLVGVGIGAPGPLSRREGRIFKTANLPGWDNVPIRDLLAESLQSPVTLENDGNVAALGEFWMGAGGGESDLVMLTLGTGVGAGVILGGQILRGHRENAAELGHMIVEANGLPCACGQRGCLEQYASAGAVARRTVAAIEAGEASELAESVNRGETIDAKAVARGAQDGDPLCRRIWDEACLYIAIACINIQHAYNPACVILGGGMSGAKAFLLDGVRAHINRQKWSLHDDLPAVSLATLGNSAGVVGAARLAWLRYEEPAVGKVTGANSPG